MATTLDLRRPEAGPQSPQNQSAASTQLEHVSLTEHANKQAFWTVAIQEAAPSIAVKFFVDLRPSNVDCLANGCSESTLEEAHHLPNLVIYLLNEGLVARNDGESLDAKKRAQEISDVVWAMKLRIACVRRSDVYRPRHSRSG